MILQMNLIYNVIEEKGHDLFAILQMTIYQSRDLVSTTQVLGFLIYICLRIQCSKKQNGKQFQRHKRKKKWQNQIVGKTRNF